MAGDDAPAHALVQGAGNDAADVAPVVVAVAAQGLVQQGLHLGVHLRHVKHAPALEQLGHGGVGEVAAVLNARMATSVTLRERAAVTLFFDDLELVELGVVPVPQWRPRSELEAKSPAYMWGGVGRKTRA